jgi:hypothetical protein
MVEILELDLTRIRVLSAGLGIIFNFTSGTAILLTSFFEQFHNFIPSTPLKFFASNQMFSVIGAILKAVGELLLTIWTDFHFRHTSGAET